MEKMVFSLKAGDTLLFQHWLSLAIAIDADKSIAGCSIIQGMIRCRKEKIKTRDSRHCAQAQHGSVSVTLQHAHFKGVNEGLDTTMFCFLFSFLENALPLRSLDSGLFLASKDLKVPLIRSERSFACGIKIGSSQSSILRLQRRREWEFWCMKDVSRDRDSALMQRAQRDSWSFKSSSMQVMHRKWVKIIGCSQLSQSLSALLHETFQCVDRAVGI